MLKQVTLTFLFLLAVVVNADACPGDTNGDSAVNVPDLFNVFADWGTDGSANGGDLDGNGLVNVADLIEVLGAWGTCVEAVPVGLFSYRDNTISLAMIAIDSRLFENPARHSLRLSLDELTTGEETIFLGEQDMLFTDLTLVGSPIDEMQWVTARWTKLRPTTSPLFDACVQVFEVVGGEPVGDGACTILDCWTDSRSR